MPKSKKHLIDAALALRASGATRKAIATQLGVSNSTVGNWLNMMGKTRQPIEWSTEQLQILLSDLPLKEIGKHLGIDCEARVAHYRYNQRIGIPENKRTRGKCSKAEFVYLIESKRAGLSIPTMAQHLNRVVGSVRGQLRILRDAGINLDYGSKAPYEKLLSKIKPL